uniref:Calcium voltage-gated channel auxiliary subunit gamma 7 n=1 Tax=Rhinolophus ferrumequinum TaxID=59479 RepID=A0A671EHQ5_RHIFE
MSHCSSRALTLLSSVFGACGLLLVGIAVSTDYWLYMEEGTVLPQNQTTEVKMALHAGLWRVCFFAGREKGRCVASEYFLEPEINLVTENTENILKTVRTATPFPMVSLFLVFTAFVISNIGHIRPQRTILAFVSGIFFILSGGWRDVRVLVHQALRRGGDVSPAPGLLPPASQRLLRLLGPVPAAGGVAPRPQPLRHLQRRVHSDDAELPSRHQVSRPSAHLHLTLLRPRHSELPFSSTPSPVSLKRSSPPSTELLALTWGGGECCSGFSPALLGGPAHHSSPSPFLACPLHWTFLPDGSSPLSVGSVRFLWPCPSANYCLRRFPALRTWLSSQRAVEAPTSAELSHLLPPRRGAGLESRVRQPPGMPTILFSPLPTSLFSGPVSPQDLGVLGCSGGLPCSVHSSGVGWRPEAVGMVHLVSPCASLLPWRPPSFSPAGLF